MEQEKALQELLTEVRNLEAIIRDMMDHASIPRDLLREGGYKTYAILENILNLENGIAVQMHTRLKKQMDDLEQLANLTQKYHVLTNEMKLDFLSAKEEPEKVHPEPAAQVEPKEAAPEPEIQPANEPDTHVTEPEPDKQPAEEEKESGAAKPNRSLQDVLEKQSLSDFKKAFSLNDRFRFRRDLFHGDEELMNQVIADLNQTVSLQEALAYINTHLAWNLKDESAADFVKLLEKRYL